jgi:dTDP-4-amino-4,6-dideoxygalactose transaminase
MRINYIDNKAISYDNVKKYLNKSIKTNIFTNNGPVKYDLERKLEKIFNISDDKKIICLNSGTSALHTLLFFYEKKYKRKLSWVSPSFTFASIITNDSDINILDIDSETKTLPLNFPIEQYDGVIITNTFGSYSDIKVWEELCKKHDKLLIFDNASSPLSEYDNTSINNYGNASFGSLHHTKYLGFGEGGFITINEEYYDDINAISNFGFHGDRIPSTLSSNFKMSDLSAAFILQHLNNVKIDNLKTIQEKIIVELSNINGVELFNYNKGVVYGNIPVLFESPMEVSKFHNLGIEANKYYKPLRQGHINSNNLYNNIINLPLHESINDYDVDYLIKMIKKMLNGK